MIKTQGFMYFVGGHKVWICCVLRYH